jgi:hypothetical protein
MSFDTEQCFKRFLNNVLLDPEGGEAVVRVLSRTPVADRDSVLRLLCLASNTRFSYWEEKTRNYGVEKKV